MKQMSHHRQVAFFARSSHCHQKHEHIKRPPEHTKRGELSLFKGSTHVDPLYLRGDDPLNERQLIVAWSASTFFIVLTA